MQDFFFKFKENILNLVLQNSFKMKKNLISLCWWIILNFFDLKTHFLFYVITFQALEWYGFVYTSKDDTRNSEESARQCVLESGNIVILFFFYSNIIIVQMCVVRAGRVAPQFICMDACGDKAGTRLRATARFYFIRYFSGNKNCFTSFIVAFMIILIYSRVYRKAVLLTSHPLGWQIYSLSSSSNHYFNVARFSTRIGEIMIVILSNARVENNFY